MVMDDLPIIMITVPIYVPLITMMGFDPLWFGILFIVNMQMAYLTPPFGFVLFCFVLFVHFLEHILEGSGEK